MENEIKELKSHIRAIANDQNIPSAVIVAFQDGEIIFKDVFGYKNKETYELADFNTIYRSASGSKHVSAITLLTLVDKGLVELDEDISTYLGYKVRNPYYPDIPITVRMVMSFTGTFEEMYTYYNVMTGDFPPYKLSEILKEDGPGYDVRNFNNHKPGTFVRYSNLSMGMMGAIVEKVTGKKFAQYAKEAVFDPLDITASYDQRMFTPEEYKRIATPYEDMDTESPLNDKMYADPEWMRRSTANKLKLMDLPIGEAYRAAQGNMHIVPTDLAKIEIALMNKGVYKDVRMLSEKSVEEMFKVVAVGMDNTFLQPWEGPIYQGIVARMYDHFIPGGHRVVEFSGRNYGAESGIVLLPEKKFGVIAYANGMKAPIFSFYVPKPLADIIRLTYNYLLKY